MFDYRFDYRDRLDRIRRMGKRSKKSSKAERYVLKINEGCAASQEFKEWLLSRPLDAYIKQVRGQTKMTGYYGSTSQNLYTCAGCMRGYRDNTTQCTACGQDFCPACSAWWNDDQWIWLLLLMQRILVGLPHEREEVWQLIEKIRLSFWRISASRRVC